MTAQKGKGHKFTTEKSKKSESKHIRLISEVFNEFRLKDPKWSKRKKIGIDELIGEENVRYARQCNKRKNKPCNVESDGGLIYYDGKLVGACDDKFQTNRKNAVQRAAIYKLYFDQEYNQILISCNGAGFKMPDLSVEGGSSTGVWIDIAIVS